MRDRLIAIAILFLMLGAYAAKCVADSASYGNGVIDLGDVSPKNYTGQAGKALIVNPAEDGMTFGTVASSGGGRPASYGNISSHAIAAHSQGAFNNFSGSQLSKYNIQLAWNAAFLSRYANNSTANSNRIELKYDKSAFSAYSTQAVNYHNMVMVNSTTAVTYFINWSTGTAGSFGPGNDSNSGLDAAHPLKTFAATIAKIPAMIKGWVKIKCAPVWHRNTATFLGISLAGPVGIMVEGTLSVLSDAIKPTAVTQRTDANNIAHIHKTGANFVNYSACTFNTYSCTGVPAAIGQMQRIVFNTRTTIYFEAFGTLPDTTAKCRVTKNLTHISGADAATPTTTTRDYCVDIGASQQGMVLKNLVFEYAKIAGVSVGAMTGNVYEGNFSRPNTIVNCDFYKNHWGAYANQCNVYFASCYFRENVAYAELMTTSISGNLDCLFYQNPTAISGQSAGQHTLKRNRIGNSTNTAVNAQGCYFVFSSQKNSIVNSNTGVLFGLGASQAGAFTNVFFNNNTNNILGAIPSISDTTGSGTPQWGTNCPASTLTAPYTWIKFTSQDGSAVYIPAFK